MSKRWIPKPPVDDKVRAELASSLAVDPIIAGLLIQRGINDFDAAREFFRPDIHALHDPFLIKDMDRAVHRLSEALELCQPILVYGDYDVDGTTAVTLVYSYLKELGANCDYYIPDRYTEGYGFSFLAVDYAKEKGIKLIITLDCGIKDAEKIAYAKQKGIDVIICDHHHVGELPPAFAVLDPQRADCPYPYKGLSGCGVGFKLLQGLCIQNNIDTEGLMKYLDLLTISIGADIVPLTDENRILAYYGLQLLAQEEIRPGIRAILNSAKFNRPEITITDVVFILSPRINAAGRLVSGRQAVELLLASTLEEAMLLSPRLEDVNAARKEFDKNITTEAHQQIMNDDFYRTSFTTVVSNKGWHKGVVGIVASRLIEAYYKPTIVLVDDGDKMSGSARSIQGVDLLQMLDECAPLLEQYGGHTMAAGLSLKSENFEAFRLRFDEVVNKKLNSLLPSPFMEYDEEIQLAQITPKFYRIIKQFSPFGPQNMRPVFLARNIVDAQYTRPVGESEAHLKLHIKQEGEQSQPMYGIAFDMGKWSSFLKAGGKVDIIFSMEENIYNGTSSLQLFVKDIKKAGEHQTEKDLLNGVSTAY